MVRPEFFDMVFCSLSACLPLSYVFGPLVRFPFPLGSTPPLHLSAVSLIDEDTAQYLSEALATSSQDQPAMNATDIKNALEEVRTGQGTKELGFEDRVSSALSILGVLGH